MTIILSDSNLKAEWDSISVSLELSPNPELINPLPSIAVNNDGVRELTIPQGDIVGLNFTIFNSNTHESPPMALAKNPYRMPIVTFVIHPDGTQRVVSAFAPMIRRAPIGEGRMQAGEKQQKRYFIYNAYKDGASSSHSSYAFPELGRYEIFVIYEAATAQQQARAIREGVPSELLSSSARGWDAFINARINIPSLPPIFISNRVVVNVTKPFTEWKDLMASGLNPTFAQYPWREQIKEEKQRLALGKLVTQANRPWLTQWWNGDLKKLPTNTPKVIDVDDPLIAGDHYTQAMDRLRREGYDVDSLREKAPEAWQEYRKLESELDSQHHIEGKFTAQAYYQKMAALTEKYVREHLRPMSQEELADALAKRAEEQRVRQEAFQKRLKSIDPREQAERAWLMWKLTQLSNPSLDEIDDPERRKSIEQRREADLKAWLASLPPEVAVITEHLLSQNEPQISDRIRSAWEKAIQQNKDKQHN